MREAIKYEVGKTYKGYGDIKGIDFKLVKREGDICLFDRSDGYSEVIELRHQKASKSIIAGKEVDFQKKEIYPYGDSFDGACVSRKNGLIKFIEKLGH